MVNCDSATKTPCPNKARYINIQCDDRWGGKISWGNFCLGCWKMAMGRGWLKDLISGEFTYREERIK